MEARDDGLPQPPTIPRSLSFGAAQIVGIPLLLALPVLALLGVFGVRGGEATVAAAGLEAQVAFPARFRYKRIHPFEVRVRNTGGEPLSRVTVAVDRAYLSAFSGVRFTPRPDAVTEQAYIVELRDIPPGGARYVAGSVQAEEYGRHRGTVRITADTGARLEARVATITFP